MVNINTLKHYGKLGHSQKWNKTTYKNAIIKSHYWLWASFPTGNCNKIIKFKNDIVITAYRKVHSFFYKNTGKLGWSSICLRFSQFEPEIMLDGMLKFKTHFLAWYCVSFEHCNDPF